MDFYDILDQVIDLLKQRGRASYRALQRQFAMDDAYLEDLKIGSRTCWLRILFRDLSQAV
jgi:hypothetical protein